MKSKVIIILLIVTNIASLVYAYTKKVGADEQRELAAQAAIESQQQRALAEANLEKAEQQKAIALQNAVEAERKRALALEMQEKCK